MLRRLIFAVVFLAFAAALAAGGGYLWFKAEVAAPGPVAEDRAVLIPPGSGMRRIAAILAGAGFIRSEHLFLLAARLQEHGRALKAGEFRIPARSSILGLLDVLRKGETVARTLTIPEGLSVYEAMAVIAKAEGLQGALPPAPGEGRLLPETYHYHYYDERAPFVRRLEKAMDAALARAWDGRAPDLPLASPEEALILASIVEKETAVAAERPRVAAVFVNRLRLGMKLQSDPTVIYGITEGKQALGRALTRADLDAATPWNTYAIAGLPPTPIALPGLASIQAVLNPATTKDLYFVADGTGGHAFAETLDGHNRNVAKWRKIQNSGK